MYYKNMEIECSAGYSNEFIVSPIARKKNSVMTNQLYQQKILSKQQLQGYSKRSGVSNGDMMLDERMEITCLAATFRDSTAYFSVKMRLESAQSILKTQFPANTEEFINMENVEKK